jgi:hypothetical protein
VEKSSLEQGWVYVLVNPSIPGLAKIGQTSGLPAHRAAELSRHTGVATPFVLVWEQEFADCVKAERDIHAILDRRGMRHMPNREFFRGAIPELISLVQQYAQDTGDCIARSLGQTAQELLVQADRTLHGDGDTLQDLDEAIHLYHLATKRGSIVAYERLGAIIAQVHAVHRGGRARAMNFLREGIRRGNYYCHCEVAAIAAAEGHIANFMKAWDHFFAQRQSAFVDEAEIGDDRYTLTLQRYVVTCFTLGITPGHLAELTASAEALVQSLARTHRTIHPALGARRNLTVPLRWAYRTLLGRPYPGDRAWSLWSWLPRRAERRRSATA